VEKIDQQQCSKGENRTVAEKESWTEIMMRLSEQWGNTVSLENNLIAS
jgi:hypothetical protein